MNAEKSRNGRWSHETKSVRKQTEAEEREAQIKTKEEIEPQMEKKEKIEPQMKKKIKIEPQMEANEIIKPQMERKDEKRTANGDKGENRTPNGNKGANTRKNWMSAHTYYAARTGTERLMTDIGDRGKNMILGNTHHHSLT